MMFSLEERTIFLTLAGSQAHGTARAGSDIDVRGICVAPMSVRLSLFEQFEQEDGVLDPEIAASVRSRLEAHPTSALALDVKVESVIFDIAKFVRLCAAANPNALEILFADEADWLRETRLWRRLHEERQSFLTRRVQQTFLGYALAQLKRIKSHRAWLLDPPARKPVREEFGLPAARSTLNRDDQNRIEQSIAAKVRDYRVDDIDMSKPARIAVRERMEQFHRDLLSTADDSIEARLRAVATDALDLPEDVVAALNAERRYRAAMKNWHSYETWKRQRNPARAELEREHGYDTKHAMHLVRLMRMGLEVLEGGELKVRRPDAAELNAIRDGTMSFDELQAAAERLQQEMKRAAWSSTLPEDIDRDRVDRLLAELIEEAASEGSIVGDRANPAAQ